MGSVSRGLEVIEMVTEAGKDGLPFSTIVQRSGIPKATAHRLLAELVEVSALTLDAQTRCYRGGLRLARIGAAVIANFDLRTAARPCLQGLHDELGHVTTLGIRSDDTGVYIDKIEPRDFGMRMHSEIGRTFPLHCTAMGKLLLSHAEPEVIRRLTSRKLESYTPNTLTDSKALRRELKRVRTAGYAVDDEEITRGLVCVAAPTYGLDGAVAGAMSCTFPAYLRNDEAMATRIEAVRRWAAKVAATDQPVK